MTGFSLAYQAIPSLRRQTSNVLFMVIRSLLQYVWLCMRLLRLAPTCENAVAPRHTLPRNIGARLPHNQNVCHREICIKPAKDWSAKGLCSDRADAVCLRTASPLHIILGVKHLRHLLLKLVKTECKKGWSFYKAINRDEYRDTGLEKQLKSLAE